MAYPNYAIEGVFDELTGVTEDLVSELEELKIESELKMLSDDLDWFVIKSARRFKKEEE